MLVVSVIMVIRLLTDDNDNDDDDCGEGGRDIDGDDDCEATEATTTTMMIIRMMMAVVVERMAVVILVIRNPVHTWLATTQSPRLVVRPVRTIHKACHYFRFVSFPQLSANDPVLILRLECRTAYQSPGGHSG